MKTITNIILILIIMILNACNYQLDHYRLDSSVTDREATLIHMAMQDMCDQTDNVYCPVIDDSGDGLIKVVDQVDKNNPNVIGRYTSTNLERTILLTRGLSDKDFIQVTIHELSHAKCSHLNDGSIMEAYTGDVIDDYNHLSDDMRYCLEH